jgi:hypothetical protein
MKLFNILRDNSEGTTIDPLTYTPQHFKNGYAVSLTDNAFSRLTVKATADNAKKLKQYAKSMNIKNYYFGYWRDNKTGINYFDLSIVLTRKIEALSLARIFGQKAKFDFKQMASIYL